MSFQYALGRDRNASMRYVNQIFESVSFKSDSLLSLYFQNWMWRYQTGYLLHPDIPIHRPNLRVADIGCGTGFGPRQWTYDQLRGWSTTSIWLIELARSLPAPAQLDGYDISSAQFPPKEWCPENVNLQTLDAFDTPPQNLVGTYDVVHLGTLFFIIRNENPSPLLANVMQLLSMFMNLFISNTRPLFTKIPLTLVHAQVG